MVDLTVKHSKMVQKKKKRENRTKIPPTLVFYMWSRKVRISSELLNYSIEHSFFNSLDIAKAASNSQSC